VDCVVRDLLVAPFSEAFAEVKSIIRPVGHSTQERKLELFDISWCN